MQIFSTYSVKIKTYHHIFKETVSVYRDAVDLLIKVCLNEWDDICKIDGSLLRQQYVEHLCHKTAKNPNVRYHSFDQKFYKFPNYLRRGAINEAKIKVYIRNTWDWLTIRLRKSDMDYIERRCPTRKQCAPTLQKRGHEWFLDFPFEEKATLCDTKLADQAIIAVDLGVNSAATVSAMRSDGTILGRHFFKLSRETDHLVHSINRIKKAQQHGNRKTPRLWAKAKGVNHDIAVKTADFIMEIAVLYHADPSHLCMEYKPPCLRWQWACPSWQGSRSFFL